MNRFRPNFVFSGGAAFEEDTWSDFQIGNQAFKAVKPCARCVMTTIDQQSAERGAEPLRSVDPDGRISGRPVGPQIKVMVSLADRVRQEAVVAVQPLLPDGVEVATSGSLFTEVTASGVDKAFGLARLSERLGVPRSDVIAFGDNHNDLPMLRWAGTSVAMANSEPVAFDAAGERTLRNDEDGVAAFLERFLDL